MIVKFVVALVVSASAGAIAGHLVQTARDGDPGPRVKALWVYHANNASQMAKDVDAVAVAQHLGVRPGRTVFSTRGEAPLAFEQDDFIVVRAFKGLRGGEPFALERVATEQPDGPRAFDADGGAYESGQDYLLFLKKQKDTGLYYVVNDQARYGVDASGRLRAIRHDARAAVSQQLAGRRLADVPGILRLSAAAPR